jgi:eukaryotic-like serine/threonine-protein kinase
MKKPRPFGKYYLLERVNVGGMAEVFKAKSFGSDGFERIVAIKRILPNIAEDPEFIVMFKDEAKISVQLNHPNIAQITDLNKVDDLYYIAMEYVMGKDLRTIFERCKTDRKAMSIAQACFIMMKVCEGLDYAHHKRDVNGNELGIVHRDISPQNVIASNEGDVKIIDFGIAKAAGKASKTQAGILKGKFGYMSPEQVRGLPLDKRSDIFSLGIVLYEQLTGERLFVGESDFSTLEKVRNVEILPPSTYNRKIPEQLEGIVLKALAKDVEDRYQTAGDFHDELQAFMYSSGEFYSRKDLAAWMKKVFSEEIRIEQKKLEEYNKIKLPPEMRRKAGLGMESDSPAEAAPKSGEVDGGDWWDDDDIETSLYDKPPAGAKPEPPKVPLRVPSGANKPQQMQEPAFVSFEDNNPTPETEPVQGNFQSSPQVAAVNPVVSPPMAALDLPGKSKQSGSQKTLIIVTLISSIILVTFLVYYFALRKPKGSEGFIEVNPVPNDNLIVKINGKELVDSNGTKITRFPHKFTGKIGNYKIEIIRKGYVPFVKTLELKEGFTNNLDAKLVPSNIKIFITGFPSKATVIIDGKEYAEKTPWSGMAFPIGTHKVDIKFGKDYFKYSKTFIKKAGEVIKVNYGLVPKKAKITVISATADSNICIVDGKDKEPGLSDCPIVSSQPYVFSPGKGKTYYLKVIKENYTSYVKKIVFDGKKVWSPPAIVSLVAIANNSSVMDPVRMMAVTMKRPVYRYMRVVKTMTMTMVKTMPPVMKVVKGSGKLRIMSKPRSMVYIDGSKKGWTPKAINLSAGKHRVTLINNKQGLRKSFSVYIKAGKSVTKIIKLN